MNEKIYLIGNSHIDPVWLWRWQEGYSEIKATFRSALDRLKEFPDFIFTSACGAYYEWIERCDPQMFEEIRARVKEGRWCITGGMWIQPDCNMPSGESFARHAYFTQRYYKEKFGRTATTGYNVDSFGHNGNMPLILRHAGMDSYVFMRPMPDEKKIEKHLFIWESADKSRVTAYRIPFYYQIFEPELSAFSDIEKIDEGTELMAFYGVGNHGGGPTVSLLNWMHENLSSRYVYSDPDRFFKAQNPEGLPVLTDDLQFHSKGCYSAVSEIKADNREAEHALVSAEKLSVLSSFLAGTKTPFSDLERAWKNTLFNQFHDVLCGCCIKEAYADAKATHGEALAIAARTAYFSEQAVSWKIDTLGELLKGDSVSGEDAARIGTPHVVFNPHPYPVKMPVIIKKNWDLYTKFYDDTHTEIPMQRVRDTKTEGENLYAALILADVPAHGYRTYYGAIENDVAPVENPFAFDGQTLKNGYVSLTFDKAGNVVDYRDERTGTRYVTASRVALYDDSENDTWAHGVEFFQKEVPATVSGEIALIESGPLRATVRATQRVNGSVVIRDYQLVKGERGVRVRVRVEYREKHRFLKFNYTAGVAPEKGKALSMIPFGTIERETDGAEYPFGDWFSFVGAGEGLGVATTGKHSFSVLKNELQFTVLRSTLYADHYGNRDGFCEYTEQGIHTFEYELFPFTTASDACRRAEKIGEPLLYVVETFHRGNLPRVFSGVSVSENVVVTAVKPAEDGGFVVRAYESDGKPATTTLTAFGKPYAITFAPHELKSLLIESDSVSEVDFMDWKK